LRCSIATACTAYRFHRAALSAGIRPIIGAELTIAPSHPSHPSHPPHPSHPSHPPHPFRLPVLIESAEGYRNLCRLVTRMKMRAPKGEGALTLAELDGHTGGLVALAGREMLEFERFGVGG
jgi:error-prone DNA polymerase